MTYRNGWTRGPRLVRQPRKIAEDGERARLLASTSIAAFPRAAVRSSLTPPDVVLLRFPASCTSGATIHESSMYLPRRRRSWHIANWRRCRTARRRASSPPPIKTDRRASLQRRSRPYRCNGQHNRLAASEPPLRHRRRSATTLDRILNQYARASASAYWRQITVIPGRSLGRTASGVRRRAERRLNGVAAASSRAPCSTNW